MTRYNGDADQQRRKKFSFPARLICADCYEVKVIINGSTVYQINQPYRDGVLCTRRQTQCHSLFQVLNKTRANISMHFVIMDDSSYTFTSSGKYALPHMYINLLFVVLFRCSSIIMKCITLLLFSCRCRLVWMSIYVRMLHLTYAAAR